MPPALRNLTAALLLLGTLLLMSCVAEEPTPSSSSSSAETSVGTTHEAFTLSCPGLESDGSIPIRFANSGVDGGENVSLPFTWSGAPDGTRSFALILVDRHSAAHEWVHWAIVNIPAEVTELPEGVSLARMPTGAVEVGNGFGDIGYGGPQPPIGSGPHTYEAILYALETDGLEISGAPSFKGFAAAAESMAIGNASVSGTFER